jgi:hypothetical protein
MSLKTALRQVIILGQALVIVVGGYSAMSVIAAAVKEHNSVAYLPFRRAMSGGALAAYVLLYALPQLVFIAAIVTAAFWWLGQQKVLVEAMNACTMFTVSDMRSYCIRRWKLVSVIAVIVISVLVLLLELHNFQL